MGLGMAIKLARTRAKKTQREVAEGARLSAIYVSFIECGRKRPSDLALDHIAAELGTTARALKRAAARLEREARAEGETASGAGR